MNFKYIRDLYNSKIICLKQNKTKQIKMSEAD